MQFFTKDMIAGWQGPEAEHWGHVFKERCARYRAQLKALEPRISKRAFRFFYRDVLHDGLFVSVGLFGPLLKGDKVAKTTSRSMRSTHAEVKIGMQAGADRGMHILSYSGVRRFALDFPSAETVDLHTERGVGYWEYGELTAADDRCLRHEVLFSSGATLLLEFWRFTCKRCRGIPGT